MIEKHLVKAPRSMRGFNRFLKEYTQLIKEGYEVDFDNFFAHKPMIGAYFKITVIKDTPDDPLDLLKDPTLKGPEVKAIAKDSFNIIEFPDNCKSPAAMKKFIRDTVASQEVKTEVKQEEELKSED